MVRKLSAYHKLIKAKAKAGLKGPQLLKQAAEEYRAQPKPTPVKPKLRVKPLPEQYVLPKRRKQLNQSPEMICVRHQ